MLKIHSLMLTSGKSDQSTVELLHVLTHTVLHLINNSGFYRKQSVQNYMSHNAPRQTTRRRTDLDQEKKNTSGSFECRSATGGAFKTYTKQQVYILILFVDCQSEYKYSM